jgi:hypothetical protein
MLYFIRSGQYVKIGISEAPYRRIASIQTSNPDELEVLAVVEGGAQLEAEMHRRFAALHYRGEWFRDDTTIRQVIAGMQTLPPHNPHKPRNEAAVQQRKAMPKDEPLTLDNWRFEIKRKPRRATRRNTGSTASKDWYYWLVRVHSDGTSLYYGTLNCLGESLNAKFRRHMLPAAPPSHAGAAEENE